MEVKLSDIDKIMPDGTIDLHKTDTKVKNWYDIGVYALNYAVSKNLRYCIPAGRITAIEGLSGTGKSLLVASAMKDPKIDLCVIIDTEGGGASAELYEFAKVDLRKVRLLKAHTFCNYRIDRKTGKKEEVADKDMPAKLETEKYIYVEGATRLVKKIIDNLTINKKMQNVNMFIVLDSIANIQSFREMQGVYDMGSRSQEISRFFRAFDNAFEKTSTAFVFTNKVYTNIGNEFVPFVSSGGVNVVYNPSVTITLSESAESEEMNDAEKKKEKERRKSSLGSSVKTVKALIKKSRFGTEKRMCYFTLDMMFGPSRISGLFKLLRDFDVIEKTGKTRYIIKGMWEDKTFYKKDFMKKVVENEEKNIDEFQKKLEEAEIRIREERLKNMEVSEDIISEDEEIEEIEIEDMLDDFDSDEITNNVVRDLEE